MSGFRGTGYQDWRTAHNPRDDYDNEAVLERIKEEVEDDVEYDGTRVFATKEEVKAEVERRFAEGDYHDE